MIKGVLITNGGPHSAADWAEATASQIVDIADHIADGVRRGAAIKLQAAIIDVLEKHHKTVQDSEGAALAAEGVARLTSPLQVEDHVVVDDVIESIVAAAQSTPWRDDFNQETFQEGLRQLLEQHFRTNMHIERSWHADRNKSAPEAIAFQQTHNVGGVA